MFNRPVTFILLDEVDDTFLGIENVMVPILPDIGQILEIEGYKVKFKVREMLNGWPQVGLYVAEVYNGDISKI